MIPTIVTVSRRLAATLLLVAVWSGNSLAQEDAGDGPTTTLPDTNVTADPQPTVEPGSQDPQQFPQSQPQSNNFPPQNLEGNSILDGTIFDNSPANGYQADTSTTGSIIAIADADNPATVNVITRDLLNDQQVLNLNDAIRNAGGVSFGGSESFFQDRIILRGIELQSRDFRRDGFFDPTTVPRDFQNVERVEILKGPASVLYGSGSPAGIVNIITKTPVDATFTNFNVTLGSFNQQRYTFDANGRVNESGTLLYRVNGAQEDTRTFRDFGFLGRTVISPTLTWILDDATRITWAGEYHRDRRRGDQGIPAINGDPLALPSDRYVGQPANDFANYEEFRQTVRIVRELNENWTFNIGGSSLFYNVGGSVTSATATPNPLIVPALPPPLFYQNRSRFTRDNEQAQSMITNLAGDFCTGEIRHQMVVGMEYIYFDSASTFSQALIAAPFNVANPVYANPAPLPVDTFFLDTPAFRQQRVGGYLQDLVHLNDYWKVFGGVRFDTVHQTFNRTTAFPLFGIPPATLTSQQNFNWVTPRGGIIYQPFGDESLAAYFNYTQSFQPPGAGIYVNPGPLRPITGEIFEGGIKTQLIEGLTFNAAGFYTTLNNADFNNRSFFLTQIGQIRSQGVELNLYGNLTERLSAVANYTYLDTRFSDVDPAFNGQRQRNVPHNNFNVWTRYNLYVDDCQTFGVALGLIYVGNRPGDVPNTFTLPSYARLDSGLFYERGRIFANAYFENINGVKYAVTSIDQFQIFPGAPFNARCQFGVTF
ncbi:MAG: TonB-dependent siderophore receptor [Pirellulales bacterium]